MIRTLIIILCFIAWAACAANTPDRSTHAASAPSTTRVNDGIADAFTVSAKVLSISAIRGGQSAILLATHVYYGPKYLQGRQFSVNISQQGNIGVLIIPPLKVGQIGIWQVEEHGQDGLVAAVYEMHKYGGVVELPAIDRDEEVFQEAEEWAKMVERASLADTSRRFDVFKEAALSTQPAASAWAIQTIARLESENGLSFLNDLPANERVSVRGQIVLDKVLMDAKREEWMTAGMRNKMLNRWVNDRVSRRDAYGIAEQINSSFQLGELPAKVTAALAVKMAQNELMDVGAREYTLDFLAGHVLGKDATTAPPCIEVAMNLLGASKQASLRYKAAILLSLCGQLAADQATAAKAIYEKEEDAQVKDVLAEIVKKHYK